MKETLKEKLAEKDLQKTVNKKGQFNKDQTRRRKPKKILTGNMNDSNRLSIVQRKFDKKVAIFFWKKLNPCNPCNKRDTNPQKLHDNCKLHSLIRIIIT